MAELLVGPMLRHVTDTSATVFVETDAPCVVDVLGCRTRTFAVSGHHYALVVLEGLEPATRHEYQVHLDGDVRWPLPGSRLPPSVIRTLGDDDEPFSMLFGSCRAAAPHEPPWSLSATSDPRGRGVDSLRAHGLRMLAEPETWPRLLILLGDQVYADEPSPGTRARMDAEPPRDGRPPEVVGGFEQYTWLYQEAWRPEIERWVFSVVPTAMIFDDHELIDDWNISASWLRDIRAEPWWTDHVVGALMSYWVYQHLGNLSPSGSATRGSSSGCRPSTTAPRSCGRGRWSRSGSRPSAAATASATAATSVAPASWWSTAATAGSWNPPGSWSTTRSGPGWSSSATRRSTTC